MPWLAKPSYNEVLRSAALEGLASSPICRRLIRHGDRLEQRGKPRMPDGRCSRLGRFGQLGTANRRQRHQIIEALSPRAWTVKPIRCRWPPSGPCATSAETRPRRWPPWKRGPARSRRDGSANLRRKAGEQVRNHSPLPAKELKTLRRAGAGTKKENQTLRERVERQKK